MTNRTSEQETDWVRKGLNPEEERKRIKRLRKLIENPERYDIFLGYDLDDPFSLKRNKELYMEIEELCHQLGNRAFLPHKFIDVKKTSDALEDRDNYVLVCDMMIPQAKLFLGYLGFPSFSGGKMIGQAMLKRKEIIYFYDRGTRLETIGEIQSNVFGTNVYYETDPTILTRPRVLYHRASPFEAYRPYLGIRGCVEFDSIKDCITKLREKIKK